MEMPAEVKNAIDDAKTRMDKSLAELGNAYSLIRSGRATPGLVEDIRVEAYGQTVPLNQVANITVPEAKLINIDVWDKSTVASIEKAILKSGRNLNPMVDGARIRIAIPELTEERRKEYVKVARQKSEDFKVAIRNIRRDTNDAIKRMKIEGVSEDQLRQYQDSVQKITDEHIKKIDELYSHKESEILKV